MTSLSQSELWLHMKNYYEQLGLEVWEDEVVPLDITSNVFLATLYARLIVAAICDHFSSQEKELNEPFYILELGVGHGKFSFYLMKKLVQALKIYDIPANTIKYVMTDISMKNIDGWRNNVAFKPYIDQGILDFALFNALDEEELVLLNAKEVVKRQSLERPIFVIANYLFDSLPHDAFQIEKGELYEVQLNLKADLEKEAAEGIKNYFENAKFDFTYNKISHEYYKTHKKLNNVLKTYLEQFEEASFTIPIGGVECLDHIQGLTKKALILFLSDKGIANSEFFEGIAPPDISIHGSFSMTVNYDALERYTESMGGLNLLMDNRNADFQVACFGFNVTSRMPNTEYAFKSSLSDFSPVDLYNLCYTFELDRPNPAFKNLDELLAILNLSQWDPNIFYDYQEFIIKILEENEITSEQEAGLVNGISKVWDYFFMLEKNRDIPFAIGCILYELEHFESALFYYEQSIKLFGEQGEAYLNMSLCHQNLDKGKEAVALARKALKLDPSLTMAQEVIKDFTKN